MRDWLKDLRVQHGMTMKDLAKKLDISESYYCCIENGNRKKKMDLVMVSELASIFHVPVSRIAEYEKANQPRTISSVAQAMSNKTV